MPCASRQASANRLYLQRTPWTATGTTAPWQTWCLLISVYCPLALSWEITGLGCTADGPAPTCCGWLVVLRAHGHMITCDRRYLTVPQIHSIWTTLVHSYSSSDLTVHCYQIQRICHWIKDNCKWHMTAHLIKHIVSYFNLTVLWLTELCIYCQKRINC